MNLTDEEIKRIAESTAAIVARQSVGELSLLKLRLDEILRLVRESETTVAILQVLANKPVPACDDRLTTEEAMKRFRITNRDSFWRFVHREKVPCVRLNARNIVFPRAELAHWEQKRATVKLSTDGYHMSTDVAMVSVPAGEWNEMRADIKRALEILTTPKVVGPILTQREAIIYVKMETEGGLRSW